MSFRLLNFEPRARARGLLLADRFHTRVFFSQELRSELRKWDTEKERELKAKKKRAEKDPISDQTYQVSISWNPSESREGGKSRRR